MIELNAIVKGVAAALSALTGDEGAAGSTHARLSQEASAQRAGDWMKATAAPMNCALYDEEPRQNAEDTLYITAEPVHSETVGGGRLRDNLVLIDLAYVTDGTMLRSQYYDFIAACDRLLRPVIGFAGRWIRPEGIAARTVDGVGHYSFTLAFFDALELPDAGHPAMETLKVRI